MANHGQLKILTTTQETAIRAAQANLQVAEVVRIYWPSPDGVINYAWWKLDDDPAYASIVTWLAGRPLIPAFVADGPQKFHELPRTSAISDDVVQMRFANQNRDFEKLCYKHRGGVKVEIFYFLPSIDGGLAVSWWLGHLRTPDSADDDYVNVTAANGFRSPRLLLPNRPHASNCTFYFGGELSAAELVGNACDYDRHLSGSRGTLNGSQPWTVCEHTKDACTRIMGDLESYGGDETVIDSTLIGGGEHKTLSTTVGNEARLKDPKRVVYGQRTVRALHLLAYAKELNPSQSHQDKGTLRTLFEVSEGRIKSISNVKVMDRSLPRPDGLGLEARLGAQRQSPTTFSPGVGNYNRTAHFRGDLNPIDPRGVKASDIVAECDVEGRDEIRIYTDETTFTTGYTRLRAWCLLDLLTDQRYGHRMDKSRFLMSDFIYLAGKGSTFDADVQGNRSAQQQVYDICLAGRWYLPFNYNGKTRLLPIEDVDLTQSDIPVFTDTGGSRNILFQNGVSRLTVSYKDDDQIPNSIIVTIEDADHDNIERPLTFEDWQQQYRAGRLYGDKSKRKVEAQYAAFGLTHVADVVPLGQQLLATGPFGTGGIDNNCAVEFVIDALDADALNLHENKVIKVVSNKLTPYTDRNGDVFQFFLVTSLHRNSSAELIVKAQAYAGLSPVIGCRSITWTNLTGATINASGDLESDASGANNCFTNAGGTGDKGAWSVETLTGTDWELSFTLGPLTGASGRTFVGVTAGSFDLNFANWYAAIHVSTEQNTIDGIPANSIFAYVGAPPNVANLQGVWNEGDTLRIRRTGNTISFLHKENQFYSGAAPSAAAALRAIVSFACWNKTVERPILCTGGAQAPVDQGGGTSTGTTAGYGLTAYGESYGQ